MSIEFVVGQKYCNRRGEYELLEITPENRLKVRYLADGVIADLDREQQERIISNIQVELTMQAQAKPSKAAASAAAKAKPAAPTKATAALPTATVPRPKPAPRRPETTRSTSSGRAEVLPPVDLKLLV